MTKQKIYAESSGDFYPNYCELWNYEGCTMFVCGNHIKENNLIWVLDWDKKEFQDVPYQRLELREDRNSLKAKEILSVMQGLAEKGSSDAMWWLGWCYEGQSSKSIFYYISAIRRDPEKHGWALDRIISDAASSYGSPTRHMSFKKYIPECCGSPLSTDWEKTLFSAIHINENVEVMIDFLSDNEKLVLKTFHGVKDEKDFLSPSEICKLNDKPPRWAACSLKSLLNENILTKIERGKYTLTHYGTCVGNDLIAAQEGKLDRKIQIRADSNEGLAR